MPAKPIFLVTSFKNVGKTNRSDRYTGDNDREDLWRVGFVHGYFEGVGMQFYYETEEQAAHFSLWTIYDPKELIDGLGQAQFVVQDIWKTKRARQPQYLPYPLSMDVWIVWFKNDMGDIAQLELQFPSERDARRFGKGRPYKAQDLFGTLPAMPIDVSEQLEQYAAAKRADDVAREAQRIHEQEAAAAQADREAAAKAKKDAAEKAGQPTPPPPPPPPPPPQPKTHYMYQSADNTAIYFWITAGGAAGWYWFGTSPSNWVPNAYYLYFTVPQLVDAGYTHYNTGSFNSPRDGLFIGDYESDVSVAAGKVIYE